MATDEAVARHAARYERVLWLYDGLNGKIIPWTKEHGGTSDDPSVQAFVLHVDGTVRTRAPDRTVYDAKTFSAWLEEQADAYEEDHPPTRLPFVRGKLGPPRKEGDPPRCDDVKRALVEGHPALVYFGRDPRPGASKDEEEQAERARKFEKKTLDSKTAADVAERVEGLVLRRFDLGDEDAVAYAKSFGVQDAPALVLLYGAFDGPQVFDHRTSGAKLAAWLKKLPRK